MAEYVTVWVDDLPDLKRGEDDEHQKYLNRIAEFAAKLRQAGDAE